MSGYISNIPLSNQSLGQTQPGINNNFTVLNTNFGIDHVDFTNASPGSGGNGGRHNTVTLVQQSVDPTPVNTSPILYCKSTTSNTLNNDIYFLTSGNDGGAAVQLTTSKAAPIAASSGTSFLPGGIIIQWGTATATVIGNTVTFATAFPTACWVVNMTCSATFHAGVLAAVSPTQTQFTAVVSAVGSVGIFYVAIGN